MLHRYFQKAPRPGHLPSRRRSSARMCYRGPSLEGVFTAGPRGEAQKITPPPHPHQTLTKPSPNPHQTLITPSPHPHHTLTTPSPHPHHTLTTPSPHRHHTHKSGLAFFLFGNPLNWLFSYLIFYRQKDTRPSPQPHHTLTTSFRFQVYINRTTPSPHRHHTHKSGLAFSYLEIR